MAKLFLGKFFDAAVGFTMEILGIFFIFMDFQTQAACINASAGPCSVLRFIGGQISPEMQTPKLLWLKENVPETFATTAHFFDLADFCTWRATGSTERSVGKT